MKPALVLMTMFAVFVSSASLAVARDGIDDDDGADETGVTRETNAPAGRNTGLPGYAATREIVAFGLGRQPVGAWTGFAAFGGLSSEVRHWNARPGFQFRLQGGVSVPFGLATTQLVEPHGKDAPVHGNSSPSRRGGDLCGFALVSGTVWSDEVAEGFDFATIGLRALLAHSAMMFPETAALQLSATFPVGDEQREDLNNSTVIINVALIGDWTLAGGVIEFGRGIGREPFTRIHARAELFFVSVEVDWRVDDHGRDRGRVSICGRFPFLLDYALGLDLQIRVAGSLGPAITFAVTGSYF
ncbi:MAG: hypothetical protein AB7K09_01440 [Planctomycetota bacterium]